MKTKNKWLLLPIILMIGFVPLIVRMYTYDCKLEQFDWFPDTAATQSDFFLYYKMVAIMVLAIVMVALLVWRCLADKRAFQWNNIFFCILAYGILALLSALFSPYRYFAFRGSYEMFESVGAVLGYLVVCFYTYQMVRDKDDVIHVVKYAGIGMLLVTLIGVFQYWGLDLFRSTFGKKLITPVSYWPDVDTLSFTFPLKTSYITLYNTNYLAFYFGLLIPVLVALVLFAKDYKWKMACAIFTVLAAIALVGSNSKSAFLAFVGTFIVGVIVLWPQLKKKWWIFGSFIVGFVAVMLVYAMRWGGVSGSAQMIKMGTEGVAYDYAITEIETNDEDVVFHVNGEELHISYQYDEAEGSITLSVLDENGNSVAYSQADDTGCIHVDDAKYQDCSVTPIQIEEDLGLQVTMDGLNWYFVNKDNTYYYYNAFGKYTKMNKIEKADVFTDSIVSGRGELWNYLIPKLKQCVILGTGANTFAMTYPNDNYIAKKYKNLESLFDVKAHNMYFQQWLEEGLLALICFLVFYVWYFVSSLRLYWKVKKQDTISAIGIGILLGTVTYMIAGLANDSNVCTAPVFWTAIGIGLAVNRIVKTSDFYFEKN